LSGKILKVCPSLVKVGLGGKRQKHSHGVPKWCSRFLGKGDYDTMHVRKVRKKKGTPWKVSTTSDDWKTTSQISKTLTHHLSSGGGKKA